MIEARDKRARGASRRQVRKLYTRDQRVGEGKTRSRRVCVRVIMYVRAERVLLHAASESGWDYGRDYPGIWSGSAPMRWNEVVVWGLFIALVASFVAQFELIFLRFCCSENQK